MLLLLLLILVLSLPFVQTKIASLATKSINEKLGTNIEIEKVDLSVLGNANFKGIKIRDHHKDTLIFVDKLSTSVLNINKILNNQVNLGDIHLSGANVFMKIYKGEKDDNLSVFIASLDDDEPKDSTSHPFELKSDNIYLENLTYKLIDQNKKDSLDFSAKNAGGNIQNFLVKGSDVSMKIRGLYLTDNHNVKITNLTTDFLYTKTKMELKNTILETNNKSKIIGDLFFNYKRKDFARFTDKVKLNWKLNKSSFSVKDLAKFYNELSGDDIISLSGKIKGTLNNFSAKDINMHSKNGMQFKGDMGFVNSFNRNRGFVFDANFKKMVSNYYQLKNILPNVLGKKLPSRLRKIGNFSMRGLLKVTPDQMDATLSIKSDIGRAISDLQLTNIDNIDNANYNGDLEFINLNLGKLLNDPLLGRVSLKADVNGAGFDVDNLKTILIGEISKIDFNGYTYKDVKINGQVENRKFDGFLLANDENCKLQFEGLADFSEKTYKFDFNADVLDLDLQKTKLFTRDSISKIKGKIKLNSSGNNIENIIGKVAFKDVVYTNPKKTYTFKEFELQSSVADSLKTIQIISEDIIKGKLTGKFQFQELLPITQNALWSIYTNYKPKKVASNQFLDFNFTIYNQIVDVFFPKVSIGSNTSIKGKINSDKNYIKLLFSSPKIEAYENIVDEIKLRVDNKNKLYNTHLTAKNVATKYYNINKLNLINRTENDTLFFKSIFKGGKKATQDFDLNFFYTLNPNQESVIGFQKSIYKYKNKDWVINPKDNHDNKVAFSLKDSIFKINPFKIVSGEQNVSFEGLINKKDKNIKANFKDIVIQNILPEIENLKMEGVLNGTATLVEKEGIIKPTANFVLENFILNEFSQGTIKAKIDGTSYEKYKVDVSIKDFQVDNVKIVGDLDFSTPKPTIDVLANFKGYELNSFSDLGEGVFSNLRGRLSGRFTAKGELLNPNFNGSLSLMESGLTFPYLNIDFDFIKNANIKLKGQNFIFENMELQDSKYDTKGYLSGKITHENFERWNLDLDLNTRNLLVLDTKEAEDIPYYGKGFIKGGAKIKGLTSNLSIQVNGSTQPGTLFVIPLTDVTTVSNFKLIKFKTPNQKNTDKNYQLDKIKGLNLKIDLDVTKDAIAQIVIDKVSGSDLKGSGTGKLDIEIDTRGKFTMNGDIEIENGVYNFKYGGIITRPFNVQKGGTISWSGDPTSAELNLTAVYRTKANPAQLLDNINSTRKIPIDLYTKISGGLFDSKQDFNIIIPNANSTVASELAFKLNDNDINTKMQHFVWLLATGTFYNEENLGRSANAFATGTAVDVASNLLSNMLSSENNKFQVNVGFTQADKTDVNQLQNNLDDVVDLSFTTQVTDRVLFNGKVGVPVGANTQNSVTGEANLEVLLNKEGSLRWKIFNKPNDIQYTLEEEGYTQGTGLSYQVNFNNLKGLFEKIGLRKKKPKKKYPKKIKDTILENKKLKIKNEEPKNN